MSSSRLPTMVKNCQSCIHYFDGKCKKFNQTNTFTDDVVYMSSIDMRKNKSNCGLNARYYQYNDKMQTINNYCGWTMVLSIFGVATIPNADILVFPIVMSTFGFLCTIDDAIIEQQIPKEIDNYENNDKDDIIIENK